MKKTITQVLYLLLLLFFAGCDKSSENGNNNAEELISTVYFSDINVGDADWDKDEFIVIRSAEEFEKYFDADKIPKIDFSKNSLLLARGVATSVIIGITTELHQKESGHYLFYSNLNLTIADAMSPWKVATLVPVLDQDAKIEFSIIILPQL